VRVRLGDVYGYQMLIAFVGDRDYVKALRLAKLVAEHFDNTPPHDDAVRLAKQLPKRSDDFSKLRLPTAKEWADLKTKLNRTEQIDYLCQRLRLLNCFQMSQPGGFAYSETQYAEPCGLSGDAAWGMEKGKTEVINPVVELAGPIDGFRRTDEKGPRGLELTTADIPQLASYLRDDWYILAVSFWRDFHPARNMHDTRELLATLINQTAKRNLCDAKAMAGMSDTERAKYIEGIAGWARDNKGKGETALLLEALEQGLIAKNGWQSVQGQADKLIELKVKAAVPILVRFLDAKSTQPYDLAKILESCRKLDPAAVKDVARRMLSRDSLDLQTEAALTLYEAAERKEALAAFARVAADARCVEVSGHRLLPALKALLDDGSAESRAAAVKLCANAKLHQSHNEYVHGRLLRQLGEAGFAEPFQFYQKMLAVEGNKLDGTVYGQPVAVVFGNEITQHFAPHDPEVQAIVREHAKPADRVPELKKWLEEKVKKPSLPKSVEPLH
jgi:hypothetical protein